MANEGDALVAGCLSPVPSYVQGKGKAIVQSEFQRQVDIFTEKKVDFLLAEVSKVFIIEEVIEEMLTLILHYLQ